MQGSEFMATLITIVLITLYIVGYNRTHMHETTKICGSILYPVDRLLKVVIY